MLLRYKLRNRDQFAKVKYEAFKRIQHELELRLGGPLHGRTLVEVGCGQWQANASLFAAEGNDVVAVDPELPPRSVRQFFGLLGKAGSQRAVKTLLNELFFRRHFDRSLFALAGARRTKNRARCFRVGGERIPLRDGTADAVFSDNVFEHIPDVPSVVDEMHRVLKPGGIVFLIIHPFAAYSGGHHLETIQHGENSNAHSRIPPWDHLRRNLYPSGVYLNRLRANDYLQTLEKRFTTLRWDKLQPEGERFLTQEILAELPGYDREELLTGKLIYTGRRE